MPNKLRDRWIALWDSIGAQGDPIPVYRDLVEHYTQPHRAYHTLWHIAYGLKEFDEARRFAQRPPEVEFAYWCHDYEYWTSADRYKENEPRSSQSAAKFLKYAGVRVPVIHRVSNMVLATAHNFKVTDPDQQLICDIDLASLGAPRHLFERSGELIRKEFSSLPAAFFYSERARVLREFLKRPSIYYTKHFRDKYERQARANIQSIIIP